MSTAVACQPASPSLPPDLDEQLLAGHPFRGPGIGREEPAEVAQPGRAEQGIGQGVECDVTVGMAGQTRRARDLDPAQAQRRARPERVAVMADPGPGRTPRHQDARHPIEIAGERHLEVAWIAGDDMDLDATGFEEGGLVGERVGAVGREAPIRLAQDVAADALWRLCRAQVAPVDGASNDARLDPLDRLRDGNDGDGCPMLRDGRRDGADQRRRDERPRRVMDEHDACLVRTGAIERGEPRLAPTPVDARRRSRHR